MFNILFCTGNNLYDWAMNRFILYGGFRWLEEGAYTLAGSRVIGTRRIASIFLKLDELRPTSITQKTPRGSWLYSLPKIWF